METILKTACLSQLRFAGIVCVWQLPHLIHVSDMLPQNFISVDFTLLAFTLTSMTSYGHVVTTLIQYGRKLMILERNWMHKRSIHFDYIGMFYSS
jgi:hypothetical protein